MLVNKVMLLKCKFFGLIAVVLLLGACADEVVVEQTAPSAPSNEMTFDAQKASAGKDFYKDKCEACHGKDGLSTLYPSISHAKYATSEALTASRLRAYTEANMPPLTKGTPNECNTECADAIQNYFYQSWSEQKGGTSSSVATNVSSNSATSSSAVAIVMPDRTVPNFKGDLDPDEVAKGKQLYVQHNCGICHGAVGGYDGEVVLSKIHNKLAFYVVEDETYNDLYFTIHESMPSGNVTSCENDCASAIAVYIQSWTAATGEYVAPASSSSSVVSSSSLAMSSSSQAVSSSSVMSSSSSSAPAVPTGPTQVEIDARVAAGKVLYTSNGCGACHGADGTVSAFASIVNTAKNYDEIENIIANGSTAGVLAMPACSKPAVTCAPAITDYVWVELLGNTLTF